MASRRLFCSESATFIPRSADPFPSCRVGAESYPSETLPSAAPLPTSTPRIPDPSILRAPLRIASAAGIPEALNSRSAMAESDSLPTRSTHTSSRRWDRQTAASRSATKVSPCRESAAVARLHDCRGGEGSRRGAIEAAPVPTAWLMFRKCPQNRTFTIEDCPCAWTVLVDTPRRLAGESPRCC
jgi:hypothetical protein